MNEVTYALDRRGLEVLRDIGLAASADECRQVIACVCIEVFPDRVTALATDSYMLAVRIVTRDAQPKRPKPKRFSVLLKADELIKAAKASLEVPKGGRRRNGPVVVMREVKISEDAITFETHSGSVSVAAYKDGEKPARYPDFGTILNPFFNKLETSPRIGEIAMNHEFVGRLSRALSLSKTDPVVMKFVSDLDPILFTSEVDPDSFGLLMPVRRSQIVKVEVAGGAVVSPPPVRTVKVGRRSGGRAKQAAA